MAKSGHTTVPDPEDPTHYISKDVIKTQCTLNINQDSPHEEIQCPVVESIPDTQLFLNSGEKHRIDPETPTCILIENNKELSLLVKQTKWSNMTADEIEDIHFLTKTPTRLSHFYNSQEIGSY
ncbi:hypothetical protein MJO28_010634 [Puccinia striiformis f. sp. tritici]|uniref:Uncharacterized protein n=1 Tax=Puccinia striiformis f. sp. tritici TaxID=168172 RepID=A0ACC0E512_9BASI|nr:hypothetical protein MJO28_010634 [Puccinia striiformis f. sp. tritici]